jgi:Ca2+-binding RTX toxin-like protein
MRRGVLLACACALALPATAAAATVSSEGGTVRYVAAPGEANDARLSLSLIDDRWFVVVRGSAPAEPGPGCEPARRSSSAHAQCALDGVGRLVVDLGDGDDEGEFGGGGYHQTPDPALAVELHGGDGNDRLSGTFGADDVALGGAGNDALTGAQALLDGGEGADGIQGSRAAGGPGNDLVRAYYDGDAVLDGGPGQDSVVGGEGDDVIRTRDGEPDVVWCNGGTDVTEADRVDRTADIREDVECDRSEIVRPLVDSALPARLKLDRRGRMIVDLELNKPGCHGSIRLARLGWLGGDPVGFPSGPRTRFRTGPTQRKVRVRVRLSRQQRRFLATGRYEDWIFYVDFRDPLGRRTRQYAGG